MKPVSSGYDRSKSHVGKALFEPEARERHSKAHEIVFHLKTPFCALKN